VPKVTFLGHMKSHDAISHHPDKVNILGKWPKLRTTRKLQQFTGFVNYFRKFIDQYAKIVIPLYDSIKENIGNKGRN
jgi:hypothetical protein